MGRFAAAAAVLYTVVLLTATVLQASALEGDLDNDRETLTALGGAGGGLIASSVLRGLAYALLALALAYLLRVTRARRPETPPYAMPLLGIGVALILAGRVLTDLDLLDLGDKFLAAPERTEKAAENLLDDRAILGPILLQAGVLSFGIGMVLVVVNAMRTGLLSRFMGALGVIVAALQVLPILGGAPFVELFWTGALGALFLGAWPGGRGPAWERVEAIPWPTAADKRDLLEDSREEGPEAAQAPADNGSQRPRKKKKRR